MKKIQEQAIKIARMAGEKIKQLRDNKQFQESLKKDYELVTTADLISNDIITKEILKEFPTHNILSEEGKGIAPISIESPTWIIDPIDGTVGYANYHYQVAISIAFAVQNEVQVGVVYNPFLNEMFHAVKGQGAFLNNESIQVKETKRLQECVVGTGFPHNKNNLLEIIDRLKGVLPKIRDIRRMGSPALDICWVACGRMQGFYEGELQPWDIAAARLIAIEAGAKAGFYEKKISDLPDCMNGSNLMIASPQVFEELKDALTIINK